MAGAHLRRMLIYLSAAALAVAAGLVAYHLALPPDATGRVRIEAGPGRGTPARARILSVQHDPDTGSTLFRVKGADGGVRTYVVEKGEERPHLPRPHEVLRGVGD